MLKPRPGSMMSVLALSSIVGLAGAQDAGSTLDEKLVSRFNDHLVTLASPWMEGRVPGSAGMERAKDYVEYYFRAFGLRPAFPENGSPFVSFRDPFELGGTWAVESEGLAMLGGGRAVELEPEKDFMFTGLGTAGSVTGEAVFVGYGIDNGPDGWSSFSGDEDLEGKVVIMMRFEPMDDQGKSRWSSDGWSNQAAFSNKLRAVTDRGASAVIVVNTPGADDARVSRLDRFGSGRPAADVPVFMAQPTAVQGFLEATSGKPMVELLAMANEGGETLDLGGFVSLSGKGGKTPLIAENVGAILPGKGALADEYIVIGGHLDHLGMGYFGSRVGPGELHPGADDNASGSAGVVLIAELLKESYEDLPRNADARSILFIAFSGEESGLNGSFHYVQDPIVPAEQHTMMVNWDMIGRALPNEDGLGRMTLAGANTGEGLEDFIAPFITPEASGLEIIVPEQMSGASDHTPFYRAKIPVLFSIIADFHGDYHTPADTSDKINREDAVRTVQMYHDIVLAAAQRPEGFPYVSPADARRSQRAAGNAAGDQGGGDQAGAGPAGASPGGSGITVRVGIMPASYDPDEVGVPIAQVSPGGPADEAGFEDGDRLVRWDGQKIENVQAWMGMLANYKPGDEVMVGLKRDGEEITVTIKLGKAGG